MSTESLGPQREDTTYYVLPRRRRPILRWLTWLAFSVFVLAVAGYQFYHAVGNYVLNVDNQSADTKAAALVTAPEPKNLPDRPINILILGSDDRGDGSKRSDSMILLRLDFKRQFISQLSFPRDLYVNIPGYGRNKINAAYSLGGTRLTVETLNELIGERITYFFNVDFDAFRKLVNRMGGAYIDVDRYYFNDNSGGGERFEQINVKPGYQKLNGHDALDYVRFRHYDSDLARIVRQQNLLAELKRTNRSVKGINRILDVVHSDVQTNLTKIDRLRSFIEFGLSIEKDRVGKFQMPAGGLAMIDGVGSVVTLDEAKLPEVLDSWKNPEFKSDENNTYVSDPEKIRVLVTNGSSRLGLAGRVAASLEKLDYPVLVSGTVPPATYPSTAIFYAPGKREDAKALARYFGPTASVGERQRDMPTDNDLHVIIGDDFAGLKRKWTSSSSSGTAVSKPKPDTVSTDDLASRVVEMRNSTRKNFLVPTHLPSGSSVVYVRRYNIKTGDRGTPDSMAIVLQLPGYSSLGGYRYATIMQTTMKDPPIISTATGQKGGFYTFYDGKTMQRLLWQRGDVTYWITNSLDGTLTDATIRDMARYMVRPERVRRVVGANGGASITVSDESRTP